MHKMRLARAAVLTLLAVGSVVPFSPAAAKKEKLDYDAQRPLLSLHTALRKHAEDELDAVLQELFAADAGGPAKPLVVYVHGRGHEPKKSFEDSLLGGKNRVIEKIEQHGVLVLGVNWKSKPRLLDPLCSRPFDKATAAGPLLARLAAALLVHREAHPAQWRYRKVVLLVHSMGGFVLRSAMAQPGGDQAITRLFDTRVISESDVPRDGHAQWLPAQPPGTTYVLSNPDDSTLARSTRCDKKGRPETGPRLGTLALSDAPVLAPGVIYLQLAAGERHRVFTKKGANGNPYVCAVVRDLLNGKQPVLPPAWRVPAREDAYLVPRKNDPDDACFVDAIDDVDDDD